MFCKSLLKITELKANSYGYLVVSSEVAVSYQVSFPKKLPRCFQCKVTIQLSGLTHIHNIIYFLGTSRFRTHMLK